jgi:hypothetical protein
MAFKDDYKTVINKILKDIYKNTEYWGVGKAGNEGIIKPITDEDDPNWSYYNFINTNYLVRDNIVIPYLKKISYFTINQTQSYLDDEGNRDFFKLLWSERQNIFGLNSSLKNSIIELINKTRKSGDIRENFVVMALKSLPNITVEKKSEAGGSTDFAGIDLVINSDILPKKNSTAQVKKFESFTRDKENWYIKTRQDRVYKTDLMIYEKQNGTEIHVAVFINDKNVIVEPEQTIIPLNNCVMLINYNYRTKKSSYKIY